MSVDPVLLAPSPPCTLADACDIASRFGLAAAAAHDLGSERDRTFMLLDADGRGLAVMKVSNAAEAADTLDMEAAAVEHIASVDAGLPIARPWPVPGAADGDPLHRVAWHHEGSTHWARMYSLIPGHARHDPRTLDDAALIAWGTTTARLGRALRGFIHPRAVRTMPWDVQHASRCRTMVPAIKVPSTRLAVTRVLDRFDAAIAPRWPTLRAQVVHGDLTIDNALVDDAGRIVGIVDFGDMSHTALVGDIASVLDSLGTGRSDSDLMRVARLVLDGYQRITPLDADELDVVGDLWATRLAIGVAIASWRAAEGLEEAEFAERYNDSAVAMLDHLLSLGYDGVRRALVDPHDGGEGRGLLAARRDRVFGPAVESLSYDSPIQMAAAEGTWMFDTDGRRYLDMYNNVPCVGHTHPRVVGAIARQARSLNTNLRYLHGSAIELAERLTATCPPSLDTVFFMNSGSEANDLAWRLATTYTGNTGGLCTTWAYHGISQAMAPLSPETLPEQHLPAHVERWAPTDTYRGLHTDVSGFTAAISRLAARGIAPAMTILDGVLQSDGVYDLDPAYVRELVRLTHAGGGLWVADEVQGGHGRTGETMWSFERFGIVPDFVTLGKPMGNGHPVAAVITRREIAERFAADTVFFSTFGGNQVSVAAAHAVLDVIDDERVLARVTRAGSALRDEVRAATAGVECIGDVRGMGLANAIEIVGDRTNKQPDAARAAAIKDALRRNGVLVGTTGSAANILKVRPPLAFTTAEVALFVDALVQSLDGEV
ncbi:MAG: aminotransferase [Acidimicrobiaceae bacterium]|nr:MAG: aminotransferase [Acidimicrobiaceae bacterium]